MMVTCAVVIALACCSGVSGTSAQTSERDDCVFYQNSIRLRSGQGLFSLATGQEVKTMMEYAGNTSANWPVLESFLSAGTVVIKPTDEDTVNITRNDNETVTVNVTDNSTGSDNGDKVTANVTRNTTEIKIEHKVVNNQGNRHTLDTHTETKNTTAGKNASTQKDDKDKKGKSPEKPFAKENITVHKHILNITRKVNATHNETQNVTIEETIKTVDVASPFNITSIYMILFVPLMVAWALYYHHGQQTKHYMWLLPLTMCTMSVGQDLVNQSLTLILMAPNAITAIQAFALTITTFVWTVSMNWSDLGALRGLKISRWFGVAVLFGIYQIMNHLAYAMCSLSERTVITNLSPLIVLGLERLILSEAFKPRVSFQGKTALALMVVGALLFSIQSPSFTLDGIGIAMVLLLATVPYRLAQRHFLAEGPEFPLTLLACIDGIFLGIPSISISAGRNGHLWTDFDAFTEVSICFMLVLSIVTFIGLHMCSLAMLRFGSATTYLVFSNIASLGTITLGIFFFGDRALGTSLACVGLTTNVGSGMWYSVEVARGEEFSQQVETKATQKDADKLPLRAITA